MWLPHNDDVYDLETCVRNLRNYFLEVLFDASHEAVLDITEHLKSVRRYEAAVDVCTQFLKDKVVQNLVLGLEALGLEMFLRELRKFIPIEDVIDILSLNTILDMYNNSDSENDDEMC